MPLNKVRPNGNMYDFIDATWNTVKGKCPHGCSYCYMKRFGEQPPVRFVESELKTDLGEGNTIFVGSSCDMWAEDIHPAWIYRTLLQCNEYGRNTYLFQSKNPDRFNSFEYEIPSGSILGTTIESNLLHSAMGKSPCPVARYNAIWNLKESGFKTMITIEPIMDFDGRLIDWIANAKPDWVNIGANSRWKQTPVPEPPADKVKTLISELKTFTEVKIKSNLGRLTK